jgi:predicted N-acetyltransferase YhbS
MNFELYKLAQANEVKKLFTNVFSDSEGQEEGKLIGNLASELLKTTDLSDIFTFIAKDDREIIIGCIIFTRIIFEIQVNAFILAPVAISTQHQNQGFGQKLINFGIDYLKNKNVEIVFTYGDPNFYSKVGFQNITEEIVKAPLKLTYPEGWLAQSLVSKYIKPISGDSTCVSALNNQQYW